VGPTNRSNDVLSSMLTERSEELFQEVCDNFIITPSSIALTKALIASTTASTLSPKLSSRAWAAWLAGTLDLNRSLASHWDVWWSGGGAAGFLK